MSGDPKQLKLRRTERIKRWFDIARNDDTVDAWMQISNWCHGAGSALGDYDEKAADQYFKAGFRASAEAEKIRVASMKRMDR